MKEDVQQVIPSAPPPQCSQFISGLVLWDIEPFLSYGEMLGTFGKWSIEGVYRALRVFLCLFGFFSPKK